IPLEFVRLPPFEASSHPAALPKATAAPRLPLLGSADRSKGPPEQFVRSPSHASKHGHDRPTGSTRPAGGADDGARIAMVALPLWLEYMHTADRMATTSPGPNCNIAPVLDANTPRSAA